MKILIVTPLIPPEPGGPSYYSVALQTALKKKGEEVNLLAFKEVRKYPSGIRHLLFFFKVLWQGRKADAFIILDTVSVALPAVLAGWLLRKKTVVRVGGDFVWERFIERTGEKVLLSEFYTEERVLTKKENFVLWVQKKIVFPLVTHIVFNTSWQEGVWEKPYALEKEKVSVIHNQSVKSDHVHKGGDVFLCAWRPTTFKNVDTLEKAYALAKEQCPDMELETLKDIPREKLFEKMQYARALVIPSLTELSPNMALEALGMGLPVLLTKDCGAKDIIGDAVSWIDPLDPKNIAEKMCAFMNEDAYIKAKEKAETFSFVHTYGEIAEEFLDILINKK